MSNRRRGRVRQHESTGLAVVTRRLIARDPLEALMFDLITGNIARPLLHERAPGSKLVAVVVHAVVLTLVIVIPLLRVTNSLPEVPEIMAFVASPTAPPPPL